MGIAGAPRAATVPDAAPAGAAVPEPGTAPAAGAPTGEWQAHHYSFQFLGFTSTYSCDGLADKLTLLLRAAGARPDSKATAGACVRGFGAPDKFARAELDFYTFTPVKKTDATTGPVSEGKWQPVSLSARRPFDLATGDCELVEQFTNTVLPTFATRSLDSRTTCVPHQDSGSVIDLKFEVFTSAVPARPPFDDKSAKPAKAAKSSGS